MATSLTCSCHTCCRYQSFTQPFTLYLYIKDTQNIIYLEYHVYSIHIHSMCSLQPASINVAWVLAVIMSESWCLAEKAALKGVFRHLSLVITLNYYHSLNWGALVYPYVFLWECLEVRVCFYNEKVRPEDLRVLNLIHTSSYKKSPPLCGGALVLAIKEGLWVLSCAEWPVGTAWGWVTSVQPDKLWQNTCGFPTSAHTALHAKS